MFEEYLEDAYDFYLIGVEYYEDDNERKARQYFRASTFYTAGAIEGFVNYITDIFKTNGSFKRYEIAFLLDTCIQFDSSKFKLKKINEFHKIEDKVKFMMKKFNVNYDFKTEISWSRFCKFKKLRNMLVHPNDINEDIKIAEFKKDIEFGLSSIIEIMDILTYKIFDKHLRQRILDFKLV